MTARDTARTVCLFTDTPAFGGAEQALLRLAAGLDRAQWRPALAYHPSPGVEPLVAAARADGLLLWPLPPLPEGLVGARRLFPTARRLRHWRPAVFHAHLIYPLACKFGLLAAGLARVPAIVATEQLFVDFPVNASVLAQQRLVAACVGRYLTVSHDLARKLQRRLPIPPHKIAVVPNAITVPADGRAPDPALRATLTGGSDRPVILTLARLDPQKGLRYLIEAAAQVPNAQFVIAGDGPERHTLAAQARALGLTERVTFLGFRADIPDLLASCDLFVLPSLYEGLPISVLEAMAARRPVIATAIGGTDEAVVAGETGLLVPPKDPVALAAAIQRLLAEPALAQRLAAAGYARARSQFSSEALVARVTAVYRELLAQRGVA